MTEILQTKTLNPISWKQGFVIWIIFLSVLNDNIGLGDG